MPRSGYPATRAGRRSRSATSPPPQRYTVPKADARLTPYDDVRKFPDGGVKVTVHLPYCCFPAYRADGKPSQVRVLKPDHPIAKGVPRQFELPHTEMYDEPFHVPEPDEVVLEERWASGEWFRSGMPLERRQGAGLLLPPRPRDVRRVQGEAGAPAPGERRPLAGRAANVTALIYGGHEVLRRAGDRPHGPISDGTGRRLDRGRSPCSPSQQSTGQDQGGDREVDDQPGHVDQGGGLCP